MPNQEPKDFPFKIGADPEFNIILQSKRISARKLLTGLFKDSENASGVSMGYKIGSSGIIGWDGAEHTGELRPAPSNSPEKLVENINKLFKAFSKKTKMFEITTLSNRASAGGHIHLELDVNHKESKKLIDNNTSQRNAHKKISSFWLPLMMGEDSYNLRIRLKQGYGKINDSRVDTKGNNWTYEFRVPTAEWLTTPKIAKATLAYLGTVFYEIIYNPKQVAKCKDIVLKNDKQSNAIQELAISHYGALTQTITNKIKREIKNFTYYKHYKEEIDYILNPSRVLKDKNKVGFEILRGWGMEKIIVPTKRQIMSNKQVRNAAKDIDLDRMTDAVDMRYNNDTNVSDFVRAIKHRIIAYNWKLQNEYFFFGLRKGIKSYIVTDGNLSFLTGIETMKTKRDFDCIQDTFNRQLNREYGAGITAPNGDKKRYIFVGIPYDDRIKNNIKGLLELFYNIEKGVNKAKILKRNELKDTIRNGDAENFGEIYDIYNEQTENMDEEIEYSEDSYESTEAQRQVISEDIQDPNVTFKEEISRHINNTLSQDF